MKYNGLTLNYHDGWIQRVTIGSLPEVRLLIGLNPLWTPDHSAAEVCFADIFNFQKAKTFFMAVASEISEQDGGPRINALQLDSKVASQTGSLYYFINVDTVGHLRIHCQTLTEHPHKST